MKSSKEVFGNYQGKDVYKLSLTNQNNVTISALSLGATWFEFLVPIQDELTHRATTNLILNYPTVNDYIKSPYYLCMALGRSAGRIAKGEFKINGKAYQVATNNNGNTLHGGPSGGFSNINWDSKVIDNTIVFTTTIKSQYDSFPGDLTVQITFTLTDDNQVTINYEGTSTKDTIFNPTHHNYWNLGAKNVYADKLKINSTNHLALSDTAIPTGKMTLNDSSKAFNFLSAKLIKQAVQDLRKETTKNGFDDVFVIAKHNPTSPIVSMTNPTNKVDLDIFSERNGLVVFTATPELGTTPPGPITNSASSIALEVQNLPDAPNHDNFGDISLLANDTKNYKVIYKVKY